MAYLLVCVIRDKTILDHAVYSRDMASVEFDDDSIGIALREDPCHRCSQFFVIKCKWSALKALKESYLHLSQSKSPNQGCGDNGIILQKKSSTGDSNQGKVLESVFSFIQVEISYRTQIYLPGALAYHCFNELLRSSSFRTSFLNYVSSLKQWRDVRDLPCQCQQLYDNCDLSVNLHLFVEIRLLPTVEHVCLAWCYRVEDLVKKRYLLEDAMNWLSTLGGAYSSLGDYFEHFSQKAGVVSLSQFKIAMEMGDPVMTAKCRLFYALSQMQQKNLGLSKKMIRREYHNARNMKCSDKRLIDMCQGIWSKLQYLYKQKKLMARAME